MTDWREFGGRKEQAEALAEAVAADLAAARGRATLASAGGETPKAFLAALGAHDLDWPRITVLPTDERWVQPDDPRSNARMIREALTSRRPATPEFFTFWRMDAEPETAASLIDAALRKVMPPSVLVLGMGADKHCASLFPGAAGLAEAMDPDSAALVAAMRPEGAPEPRVTLTARALAEAERTCLLIAGDEKRAALEAALADPDPLTAPVGAVLSRARRAEIYWAS